MEITKELVCHVADLARLNLSEEQVGQYQKDLSKMLEMVGKMCEVDTTGVEPLQSTMRIEEDYFVAGIDKREDEVKESLGAAAILKNAPDSKLNQFKVDAVISDDF